MRDLSPNGTRLGTSLIPESRYLLCDHRSSYSYSEWLRCLSSWVYNGTTPKTCAGCHTTDYNATTNPNHKTAGFSTACESCHSQNAWAPSTFDHNKTKFPLTGAHTTVACTVSHQGYTGTSTVCVDCHLAKFNATTKPNHKTLALSTACATCHTTAPGWAPASFPNHGTYYVITGLTLL